MKLLTDAMIKLMESCLSVETFLVKNQTVQLALGSGYSDLKNSFFNENGAYTSIGFTKNWVKIESSITPQHNTKFKKRHSRFRKCLIFKVIHPGLEPGTYCLEGSCSIQLS